MVVIAECSLGSCVASWATVFGVLAALFFGVWGIWNSNSIRKTELITTVYNAFVADDLLQFYAKIRKKEPIDWQHDDEKLLNKSLTLFDAADFLQSRGLTRFRWLPFVKWLPGDETVWEFFASEIQYFASNEYAWDYMAQRVKEALNRGFPRDIIPFTGFAELLSKIPKRFRANDYPCVPEKHRHLYNWLTSSD